MEQQLDWSVPIIDVYGAMDEHKKANKRKQNIANWKYAVESRDKTINILRNTVGHLRVEDVAQTMVLKSLVDAGLVNKRDANIMYEKAKLIATADLNKKGVHEFFKNPKKFRVDAK